MRLERLKKHIMIIAVVFMAISAMYFVIPQKASAAIPTVKIGGVSISSYNDNKWHAYNAKKPTISGWTAGKYKLSTDGKTLYIDGFKYSGKKRGITSTAALKVVPSGTNTFTCNGARGICLENADEETRSLTLAGAANSTLNIKCTNAMAIVANNLTLSSGTVNATGKVYCDCCFDETGGNLKLNGGKLSVTGAVDVSGNLTASGGSLAASKDLQVGGLTSIEIDKKVIDVGGTFKITSGSVSANNIDISKVATVAGGSVTSSASFFSSSTTISAGSLTSKAAISASNNFNITGGTATAAKGIDANYINNSGGTVTSQSTGVYVRNNLTVSKGSLTSKTASAGQTAIQVDGNATVAGTGKVVTSASNNARSFGVDGTLTVSGGTVEASNKSLENNGYCCLYANNISVTGGAITSSANGSSGVAVSASASLSISGGTITGTVSDASNSWDAIHCDRDITVKGGTLTGKSSSGDGIYVGGNATVSGTGKVVASTLDSVACYVNGALTVNGGSVETSNKAAPDSENNAWYCLYADNIKVTGGSVTARANGSTGNAVYASESLSISGGSVTGIVSDASDGWTAIICAGDITATGGTLSGTNSSNRSGIYSAANLIVSGTADVRGVSDTGTGINIQGSVTVDGGKLSGNSNNYGIYSPTITVNAGQLSGTGKNRYGIWTGDLKVTGGTVYGETATTNSYSDGVYMYSSFAMTGGKVTGKVTGTIGYPIEAPLEGVDLADDIWMSDPADGYNSLNNGYEYYGELYEFNRDGSQAKSATFQKVTSMSVKTPPTTTMYDKDVLDAKGLVLSLHFEDGSVSDLTYEQDRKEMFSFSQQPDTALSAGKHSIDVTCLTKTASFDINVKSIGKTTLSGNAYIDRHKLNWTKADGATNYILYGRKEGQSNFSQIGSLTSNQRYNSGLMPGETWEYYVVPVRKSTSGQMAYGNSSNHVTLTCSLDAPEISVTDTSFDSVSLEWKDTIGAKSYDIYRSEGGGSFVICASVDGLEDGDDEDGNKQNVSFTDTGLITGREYTYYVKAAISDKDLYSEASNTVKATPAFNGKTTLKLEGKGPFTLKWEAVDGATGYEVMRGNGSNGSRSLLASADETSYTDGSIDVYSVYNYTVVPLRSVDGNTFRGQDSNVVVTTAKDKPAPPAPKITPPSTEDPKGTVFNLLQAKAGKVTKGTVQIKWKKVKGAKKYIVYGNKCGKKNRYKKLTTTTRNNLTFKKVAGRKVAKGTYYKFIVYAVDSKGKTISTSKTIHVVTKGGKYGNDGKVTTAAKKGSVTLRKGKTFKLKAKAFPASKKHKVRRHRPMAYETSNRRVATVTRKGVIKATDKGSCYVYAYTQNGVFKKVKVTVK